MSETALAGRRIGADEQPFDWRLDQADYGNGAHFCLEVRPSDARGSHSWRVFRSRSAPRSSPFSRASLGHRRVRPWSATRSPGRLRTAASSAGRSTTRPRPSKVFSCTSPSHRRPSCSAKRRPARNFSWNFGKSSRAMRENTATMKTRKPRKILKARRKIHNC